MKKSIVASAIALSMGGASQGAFAALASDALLNFDAGAKECVIGGTFPDCTYGVTTTTGSWFSMDADGSGSVSDSERTPISQNDGVLLGTIQSASGSHSGAPDGSETPGIDNPWAFFTNTGMHYTTSATTVTSATGNTASIDFTGWAVTWNGIAPIPMGGDTANFPVDTGIANVTCAVDCSVGDTYTLSYSAHVPLGDASGFGGVPYVLNLVGTVGEAAVIPVPAAVWLFGSGLLGLVGVARRKKSA